MVTAILIPPSQPLLDLSCPPRFGTPRSPERQTLGPAVGILAAMLGKPLMEWQQYVADVLLEIDPETGELAYNEWLLTVPRQSGKTTFLLAKNSHRCMATVLWSISRLPTPLKRRRGD